MTCNVTVAGGTESLVVDLARAWARLLPWGEYGRSVVPADSYSHGVTTRHGADLTPGALVVSLASDQVHPMYSDGLAEPDTSVVRLELSQPIHGATYFDSDLLVSRRVDLRILVNETYGEVA